MLGARMSASLTLVTCTRNPNPETFRRVLDGVAALRLPPDHTVEYLVVDSTSEPPVASRAEVVAFLGQHSVGARHPVARARISPPRGAPAVEASQGAILVWFDDDNVPGAGLPRARGGDLAAAWPDGDGLGRRARSRGVHRRPCPPGWSASSGPPSRSAPMGATSSGARRRWASFFPVGSGLVTRRAAIERWSAATREGRYSLTGRKGRQLSAGDDAQIIFGAVAAGRVGGGRRRAAAHAPDPAGARCTMPYLMRLEFGLSGSIRVARAECFPGDPAPRSLDGTRRDAALRATRGRRRGDGSALARRASSSRGSSARSAGPSRRRTARSRLWLRAAIALLGLR